MFFKEQLVFVTKSVNHELKLLLGLVLSASLLSQSVTCCLHAYVVLSSTTFQKHV